MTEEDKEYRQGRSKKQVEKSLALTVISLIGIAVTLIIAILIQ